MRINGKDYKTIWYDEERQVVQIIDQTKLPHQFVVKDLKNIKDAIIAIKNMEVRGAPLIGGFMNARDGFPLDIKRWLLHHEDI